MARIGSCRTDKNEFTKWVNIFDNSISYRHIDHDIFCKHVQSPTFDKFRANEVHPIVMNNDAREAHFMIDEAKMYKIGREYGTTLHGAKQFVDSPTAPFTPTP